MKCDLIGWWQGIDASLVKITYSGLYFWYRVFDTVPLQLVFRTFGSTFGTWSLTHSSLQLRLFTACWTFGTESLTPTLYS